MRRFFLMAVFFFLFCFVSFTQSGDVSRDSVRTIVEQVIRQKQDSLKEANELKRIMKNSKPLNTFLQEMQERQQAERRRQWIRIGIGVFFFSLLLLTSIRRYKARKRN